MNGFTPSEQALTDFALYQREQAAWEAEHHDAANRMLAEAGEQPELPVNLPEANGHNGCSPRRNPVTGTLTAPMWRSVFTTAKRLRDRGIVRP